MSRDGHVRVLPIHVANKIAAGEVVERPASVAKELIENAIDAGAKRISIVITQGGRKLVAVQDDGCGMTRDDAVLSLERQATSKILDVDDIERIDTLGFRGEAIPSIAAVSRFSITTRRAESDEGTFLLVNAGTLAEVHAAGCPVGTLVEVRDLFCNVPARRKFLRSYATEESHIRQVFTVHALAHPQLGFTLTVDGRELYRLAPAERLNDRVRDIFGEDFVEDLLPVEGGDSAAVKVSGFIEKPNLTAPSRRDQYVFVNGRPATAPAIAYALREAYPRRNGDVRPAAILFLELSPSQVDVNVHPTKREVRFRDNVAVRQAIIKAVEGALTPRPATVPPCPPAESTPPPAAAVPAPAFANDFAKEHPLPAREFPRPAASDAPISPAPQPLQVEFAVEPNSTATRPWSWFKYLAQAASGYLLVETDSGIVTINPHAARERIAYEKLLNGKSGTSQALLIPETVRLSPVDFSRLHLAIKEVRSMGFQIEEFGADTFKVDAIPQILSGISAATMLASIARDFAEGGNRRAGERWREELIAKSIARSFAGAELKLTEEGATKLVEELCSCKMPYVCPRGKPVMIFTSTRELDRRFSK